MFTLNIWGTAIHTLFSNVLYSKKLLPELNLNCLIESISCAIYENVVHQYFQLYIMVHWYQYRRQCILNPEFLVNVIQVWQYFIQYKRYLTLLETVWHTPHFYPTCVFFKVSCVFLFRIDKSIFRFTLYQFCAFEIHLSYHIYCLQVLHAVFISMF
jgi:hypothetical protein